MKVSAKNVKGTLITETDGEIVFRVYRNFDFVDYKILASDVDIVILDDFVTLEVTGDEEGELDYSDEVLGK